MAGPGSRPGREKAMADARAPETEEALRELEDRFLAPWAGIAALLGASPACGRIHGLLLLADRPLDAGTIRARLGISHGSCSTGLAALVEAGAIRRIHPEGKRSAAYLAGRDAGTWFRTLAAERRRLEIRPLLEALHGAREFAAAAAAEGRARRQAGHRDLAEARDRLAAAAAFTDGFAALLDAFLAPPAGRGAK